MREKPKASWELYCSNTGQPIVREEIRRTLGDGPPKKELGELMSRIQFGRALDRDTAPLGGGLFEARLSYCGTEFRLYFAHGPQGEHILLALAFHKKGGQGAQKRTIKLARKRLSDWLGRI
ncbi:type II toxin-antitoxin system RelE/ParE family toxin [Microbispora sp. H11081]|uniref:type II toxin-antitoxin system RelE/ParE family toxin n=1 Tax=Microbispora sp. H11081 TaxID=2729107 RepID=UPI001473E8E6|nr:type II toxin-antitoxin system RelE/ParE family toxin [Microbispora sp. H11081]